jgi:ribosomal protein S18 acetylase RimI-like enzyme
MLVNFAVGGAMRAEKSDVDCGPSMPGEERDGLEVLFRRAPAASRPFLVAETHDELQKSRSRSPSDPPRLFVGRRQGRIVAALLAQRLTPRTAAVWPPEVAVRWRRADLAAAVIRAAVAAFDAAGVRLVQALVDAVAEPRAAADLERGGLPRVTDLAYLARDTSPAVSIPRIAARMDWITYTASSHDLFADALESSYADSLDMPELDGVRSLDDLLILHRAAGRFRPDRWLVGTVRGEPEARAFLVLSEPPDRPAWEVSYLGLSPQARGRGLGRAAIAHAIDLARGHASRLELAVDVRNQPARRLYRATGFITFDRRAVHLRRLDLHPDPTR